jgi:outer membrane biosynthesis protein TonB
VRALVAISVLFAGTASAGSHKLFVLRSDSTTDWATRTHVEKTVLGLARNVDRGVARGDMTYADVALSVGCTKTLDGCRVPLLDALMIDELVVIAIVPAGDDKVKVTVKRASKTGIREATATIDKADPDAALVAGVGPLFGAHKVIGEPAAPPPHPGSAKGTMTTGTVEVDNEQPPLLKASEPAPPPKPAPEPKPAPVEAKPAPKPAPVEAKPAPVEAKPAPTVVAAAQPAPAPAGPDNAAEPEHGGRPLYVGGMVAGGALAIIGVVLWEKANGYEADARAAPNRTSADIANLLDLESSGDHYALAGNITFIGGLAIAGVSGYLWWKSRDSARVTPMVVDHGGGVAVTFEVR